MPIPIVTVEQMRQWEKATWASGVTPAAVIRSAGAAIAQAAENLTQTGQTILILAGKGHNGDDACLAGEQISGRTVHVVPAADPVDAKNAFETMLSLRPALIIDGLFGIGLDRPLSADWVDLICRINETNIPILAVDVPSGLNADTGEPMPDAIRAHQTTTLGAPKRGLLAASAWPFVGRLEVAPAIGLVPCPFRSELDWTLEEDFRSFFPRRPLSGHKGTFGHLSIVAGSLGYHGASVLAARGAERAQPGLITLCTSAAVYPAVAAQLQAVMVRPWEREPDLPENITALLVGPGLAAGDLPDAIKAFIHRAWRELPLAMVVDASALAWLPPGDVRNAATRVITPHPGEAARLLETTSTEVQQDRVGTVRELSRRFGGCHVVLKGHQTLIGRSEGDVFINSSGNPYLAQGGSGDLLSGYLAGLLAQPPLQADPLLAIRFAVWQHGAAADHLQAKRRSWTVADLAEALGTVRPAGEIPFHRPETSAIHSR